MASKMMTLSTSTKSSYNTTSYRPPSEKNTTMSSNVTQRENPFMRNRNMAMQSEVKTQAPPPKVNAQNFPTLNKSCLTASKPTSSEPNKSVTTESGYSAATRKKIPSANDLQPVRRHNPNHLVLSKTNLKANEAAINEFIKELGRSLYYIRRQKHDKYFKERQRNIVEEMRDSLSSDEFDDWYEQHVEENGGYYSNNYNYNYDEYDYDYY
jgi:hypothetical protein